VPAAQGAHALPSEAENVPAAQTVQEAGGALPVPGGHRALHHAAPAALYVLAGQAPHAAAPAAGALFPGAQGAQEVEPSGAVEPAAQGAQSAAPAAV
jgi:hypothetical protein